MTNNTLFCGLALVALGVYAFVTGTPNPETGAKPMTALIPAYVGGALLLCAGLVIWKESLRKHVMHAAAMVGLIGFVGGFAPVVRGEFDFAKPSVKTGLIMSAICGVFVFLCVKSFIDARKAREKAAAGG
jgi:uncharacterized membrane protein YeaQ/YmgE (transglycosylase-associated protein family)